MSSEAYDLNPVSRITIGAIGRPGQRTFYLQASQGPRIVSLKMEKEQVAALARGIEQLLESLEQREVRHLSSREEPTVEDLELSEPIDAAFAVGQMGLGFDEASSQLVLVIQESVAEEEQPQVARLWATPEQMRALSRVAKQIVSQGRPLCPLCQRPMDPEGHFCPRGNGHSKKVLED